jgi:sugar/nucleoside kinase (ribokinase family)
MRLPVPAPPPGTRRYDAVGLGLNAVDHLIVVPHYPPANGKVELVEHALLPGGQVATAMVALSRLGHRTRYVGRVGSDAEGRLQLQSLEAEGVDVSECRVVDGAPSQVAFIVVDAATGDRTVIWRRDPRIAVRPDEITAEIFAEVRAVHLDGHNIAAEVAAARWARERGIPTSIDVDKDYDGAELYPLIDYLVTSSDFPRRVTGLDDERGALLALHERFGSPLVAMTLGERGALALCDGVFVSSPAFAVRAIDSTGAGDAFHAGFLHGLLMGLDLEATLRVANAVAGMNCRRLGARTGLPTAIELERFLAGY